MNRNLRFRRGFTLIELLIAVAVIGVLAATAVPRFIQLQARAKQAECKSNLKALYSAERSYFEEKERYSEAFAAIGFSVERGNRYKYFNSATCVNQDRSSSGIVLAPDTTCLEVDTFAHHGVRADPTPLSGTMAWASHGGADPGYPGMAGACPDCNFVAFCAGNIDNDDSDADTWMISSKDAAATGSCGNSEIAVVAGAPYNTYNDLSCGG